MLACAEDLGMIPDCVPKVMGKLKILSLELERMPKAANGMDGKPDKFPYLSVATTSSHDTEGIREWWGIQHNTLEKTHQGNTTNDTPADICEHIVLRHLLAPSMMAILPFQDLLSIFQDLRHPQPCQERINNPANPDNNWNYRLHISIDSLMDNKSFTSKIQEIVKTSGRKI
jgi:4-alpha-glucanotransferase